MQCCGARAEILGVEIKLPLGAVTPATTPASLYFPPCIEEILKKKIMVFEEVFVNCYNFNYIT
jgi:hypothetical protein